MTPRHTLATLLCALVLLVPLSLGAKNKPSAANAKEAKALFMKVYDMVWGPQGSRLSYAVNIIGLYKTSGDIIYKGDKLHYQEGRYSAWEDGQTAYMVDGKKKTVDIYRADDPDKDEYLGKFKYDLNHFDFSYRTEGDYYIITAKVRGAKFFGIREARGRVRRKDLAPVSVTIKLAFLKTTVAISNFRSGNVDDSVFHFPRARFAAYKFTDHR